MKKRITILSFLLAISHLSFAQDKKEQDQNAIKSMCGCYEVGFNFTETFQYSKDENYKPSKDKHAKALEWVQLVEENSNKIVMQHLLIAGKPSRPYIVKHWRQDWIYENKDFYMFNANNNWKYTKFPKGKVSGQWTQKVYQVDDSPRYEGTASWVHVDGKSFWENTTDAPLPRREYTKRDDYNLTIRGNRHEITKTGWIHDQDNKKVVRENGKDDIIIAEEKGYNTYVKVDDSKCKAAQDWWKENKDMWKTVRAKWAKVFSKKKDLSLATEVDGRPLFEHLSRIEKDAKKKDIEAKIDSFTK